MPELIMKGFVEVIRQITKQKFKFDLEDVDVLKNISKIKCPLLVIVSEKDQLIPYNHSVRIYNEFKGKKELHFIHEQHNDVRTPLTIALIKAFIFKLHAQKPNSNTSSNLNKNIYQLQKENCSQNLKKTSLAQENVHSELFLSNGALKQTLTLKQSQL
jgi:hypothetical protein